MKPAIHLSALLAMVLSAILGCQGQPSEKPARARTALNERTIAETSQALAGLSSPITVHLYRSRDRELGSDEAESLVFFMEENSPKVQAVRHDIADLPQDAGFLKTAHGPVLLVEGPLAINARYLGNPAEMELPPFLDWVKAASGIKPPISERTTAFLAGLSADVSLRLFVTPG